MIKPGEIQTLANRQKVKAVQVEKDYIITWVLLAIARHHYLKEMLLFKGGTALKKGYFPEYRFSEDLDFTFAGGAFLPDQLIKSFEDAFNWLFKESRIRLTIKGVTELNTGNLNFYSGYIGPLGGDGSKKDLKIDICRQEKICFHPVTQSIISGYSDTKESDKLLFYSLGEIIAEKMRALMDRTTPRDLYDLWYLLEIDGLRIEDYIYAFQEKAIFKGLMPSAFVEKVILKRNSLKSQWASYLSHQMRELPDFESVWRDFGKHLRRFSKFIEGSKAEEECTEYGNVDVI